MAEELNEAINHNDMQKIIDISAALTAYLPVYTTHYEKTSLTCLEQHCIGSKERSTIQFSNSTGW